MLDAIACEVQFLDHLAPVWRAMPDALLGRFLVDRGLVDHARTLGIDAEPIDAGATRSIRLPATRPPQGRKALVASYGDTKVARRLGYGDFAFLEHGIGQTYAGAGGVAARHPSYSGGGDRDDASIFIVPNESAAARWRTGYPAAQVEVVGCPRLDDLPRRQPGPGPVVAISFHVPFNVAPETDTALGHFMGVLPDLAKAYTVIGHGHPKGDWPKRMQRIFARAGIPFVADFAQVCREADVYVCDNSSTIYEFAATGRPVVVLNSPRYRRNVEHGLRFWEASRVGVNVSQPGDLIDLVGIALMDDTTAQRDREAALDIAYAYRSGGADRAASALVSWLSVAPAASGVAA